MKFKKVHIRFFTFCLLFSMLKVAFPIGEFFHEHHHHHSAEEECTHARGKKCQHDAHVSHSYEHHHDCVFFQLHTFFTQPYFTYYICENEISVAFFIKYEYTNRTEIYTPSRAPPVKYCIA